MKRPRNRGIFPPNLPPAVLELAKERANQKLARDLIDVHDKFINKLEEVNETIYQRVGPKGEQGAPGKTPEKGVEYFTNDELRTIIDYLASTVKVPNDGRDGKDGRDGRDGIDGKDGKDAIVNIDVIVERVRKLIKAPKDGKDATISIDDIVSKILTLPGEKFKLNTKQIDGLDQTIRAMQSQIGERGYLHGGGDTVQAGTNITLTRLANGKTLISSTGGGTPGGPVNSIQYNNPPGTFAGDAGFFRDITNATNRYGIFIDGVSGATNRNASLWSGSLLTSSLGTENQSTNVFTSLNVPNAGCFTAINLNNSGDTYGGFITGEFNGFDNGSNQNAGLYLSAYFSGTGHLGNNIVQIVDTRVIGPGIIDLSIGSYFGNPVITGGGGITKHSALFFEDITSATTNYVIEAGLGLVKFGTLAGTGTRLVTADSTGQLGTATASGLELTATGTVNGINKVYTMSQRPSYIVADGVWYKATDKNSVVQWTYSGTTLTMTIPPNTDIWGVI